MQQYTNELTSSVIASFDAPRYTDQQLSEMNVEARNLIIEQQEYARHHPITAIYRAAVAGSLTLRGGVVDESNPDPSQGMKVQLDNGQWVSMVTEGATVTYPDGTKATIITSAGQLSEWEGKGIALVGSLLDNGDQIISTPDYGLMFSFREGELMPDDFLTVAKVA
ncbi:hypothetical protein ACVGWG_13180 [Enterobacter asburiae]|jgi:hypothetical protein|uniref:hypothetical protein n=1 Tax=Enterobacter TaxID=547 RepID=UPI000845F30B|nr:MULTISPECIES: hypothetical protein [Enterobacter]SHH42359.1 hypothetical protein SAMN05428958_105264 [Pantoea sesami]AOL13410.1 hypothetical protein EnteroDNA1_02219 [Enterobacter sp. HK169]EHN8802087.1 hypothetical protein [Enterobacter asburiae]MBS0845750.1 hypothetical protein [Enterobacter asburiae]MBT2051337.1 hypothetical protein [Enterobacter asburiae]